MMNAGQSPDASDASGDEAGADDEPVFPSVSDIFGALPLSRPNANAFSYASPSRASAKGSANVGPNDLPPTSRDAATHHTEAPGLEGQGQPLDVASGSDTTSEGWDNSMAMQQSAPRATRSAHPSALVSKLIAPYPTALPSNYRSVETKQHRASYPPFGANPPPPRSGASAQPIYALPPMHPAPLNPQRPVDRTAADTATTTPMSRRSSVGTGLPAAAPPTQLLQTQPDAAPPPPPSFIDISALPPPAPGDGYVAVLLSSLRESHAALGELEAEADALRRERDSLLARVRDASERSSGALAEAEVERARHRAELDGVVSAHRAEAARLHAELASEGARLGAVVAGKDEVITALQTQLRVVAAAGPSSAPSGGAVEEEDFVLLSEECAVLTARVSGLSRELLAARHRVAQLEEGGAGTMPLGFARAPHGAPARGYNGDGGDHDSGGGAYGAYGVGDSAGGSGDGGGAGYYDPTDDREAGTSAVGGAGGDSTPWGAAPQIPYPPVGAPDTGAPPPSAPAAPLSIPLSPNTGKPLKGAARLAALRGIRMEPPPTFGFAQQLQSGGSGGGTVGGPAADSSWGEGGGGARAAAAPQQRGGILRQQAIGGDAAASAPGGPLGAGPPTSPTRQSAAPAPGASSAWTENAAAAALSAATALRTAEAEAESSRASSAALASQLAAARTKAESLQGEVDRMRAQADEAREAAAVHAKEVRASAAALSASEAALEHARRRAGTAEQALGEATRAIDGLQASLREARQGTNEARAAAEGASSEFRRASEEVEALRGSLGRSQGAVQALQSQLREAQAQSMSLQAQLRDAQASARAAASEVDSLRRSAAAAAATAAQASARLPPHPQHHGIGGRGSQQRGRLFEEEDGGGATRGGTWSNGPLANDSAGLGHAAPTVALRRSSSGGGDGYGGGGGGLPQRSTDQDVSYLRGRRSLGAGSRVPDRSSGDITAHPGAGAVGVAGRGLRSASSPPSQRHFDNRRHFQGHQEQQQESTPPAVWGGPGDHFDGGGAGEEEGGQPRHPLGQGDPGRGARRLTWGDQPESQSNGAAAAASAPHRQDARPDELGRRGSFSRPAGSSPTRHSASQQAAAGRGGSRENIFGAAVAPTPRITNQPYEEPPLFPQQQQQQGRAGTSRRQAPPVPVAIPPSFPRDNDGDNDVGEEGEGGQPSPKPQQQQRGFYDGSFPNTTTAAHGLARPATAPPAPVNGSYQHQQQQHGNPSYQPLQPQLRSVAGRGIAVAGGAAQWPNQAAIPNGRSATAYPPHPNPAPRAAAAAPAAVAHPIRSDRERRLAMLADIAAEEQRQRQPRRSLPLQPPPQQQQPPHRQFDAGVDPVPLYRNSFQPAWEAEGGGGGEDGEGAYPQYPAHQLEQQQQGGWSRSSGTEGAPWPYAPAPRLPYSPQPRQQPSLSPQRYGQQPTTAGNGPSGGFRSPLRGGGGGGGPSDIQSALPLSAAADAAAAEADRLAGDVHRVMASRAYAEHEATAREKSAPYATEANVAAAEASLADKEAALLSANLARSALAAELSSFQAGAARSVSDRKRKAELGAQLAEVERELSDLRMWLKANAPPV